MQLFIINKRVRKIAIYLLFLFSLFGLTSCTIYYGDGRVSDGVYSTRNYTAHNSNIGSSYTLKDSNTNNPTNNTNHTEVRIGKTYYEPETTNNDQSANDIYSNSYDRSDSWGIDQGTTVINNYYRFDSYPYYFSYPYYPRSFGWSINWSWNWGWNYPYYYNCWSCGWYSYYPYYNRYNYYRHSRYGSGYYAYSRNNNRTNIGHSYSVTRSRQIIDHRIHDRNTINNRGQVINRGQTNINRENSINRGENTNNRGQVINRGQTNINRENSINRGESINQNNGNRGNNMNRGGINRENSINRSESINQNNGNRGNSMNRGGINRGGR